MGLKADTNSLVQRTRKKDIAGMRMLYECYAKEMLATSFRITNDLQGSEDILQDSFLDAFQKIDQLKDNSKYGSWLKRIVINKSLASIKRRVSYQELPLVVDLAEEEETGTSGYSISELQNAIQSLPDGCRQIFCLFLLDGYKHREIADSLNIKISTSKSQYRYALKLLREKLSQHYND